MMTTVSISVLNNEKDTIRKYVQSQKRKLLNADFMHSKWRLSRRLHRTGLHTIQNRMTSTQKNIILKYAS